MSSHTSATRRPPGTSVPGTWTGDAVLSFREAAEGFAALVERVSATDPAAWEQPGLGVWNLRALVGHTSRSLSTLITYLKKPAAVEDIDSPERYYALTAHQTGVADAVAERGRQAGTNLGDQPARTINDFTERAIAAAATADPNALITTIGGGMRVRTYLPTRTFELVVHSLDIAAATDQPAPVTPNATAEATELAARIAVLLGHGPAVLTALTGRRTLPHHFSIVA
jgi:uncharacterized protein (TIGR03083 family)